MMTILKQACLALILSITIQSPLAASESQESPLLSYDELKTVGVRYINLLREIGQSDGIDRLDASPLISPRCEKIENGNVLIRCASDLANQLARARNVVVGKWTITTTDDTPLIIPAEKDQASTLQFVWQGEKMGAHTTMVILSIGADQKITRINEIFNTYQQQTPFALQPTRGSGYGMPSLGPFGPIAHDHDQQQTHSDRNAPPSSGDSQFGMLWSGNYKG